MPQADDRNDVIIANVELKFIKSTGGTHVFGNEDRGFKSIYIPKMLFQAGVDVTKLTVLMRLQVPLGPPDTQFT